MDTSTPGSAATAFCWQAGGEARENDGRVSGAADGCCRSSPLRKYAARLDAEAPAMREVVAFLGNGNHAKPTTTTRKRWAKPNSRREQILAIVTASPGITVTKIAQRLGVDPTGLYRPVYALKDDGLITKQGRQLRLR
jgi:hypothetical protein